MAEIDAVASGNERIHVIESTTSALWHRSRAQAIIDAYDPGLVKPQGALARL
jgi:hypothetical protein